MMDGGLSRVPGRPDRTAANRPDQARRQPVEPQVAAPAEPRMVPRAATPSRAAPTPRPTKRFVWPIIIAALVVLIGVAGWLTWSKTQTGGMAIDSGKYQAVFFTNGQVYFGKLQPFNNDYVKLTDIYYLQSGQAVDKEKDSKNPQQTSTDQSNVQLIKLGEEVHGPEDTMMISKDQLLFYENLKADGKVAQSIAAYKKDHK